MPRQPKIKLRTPQQALETLQWMCSKMERCALDSKRSLVRWGVTDPETQNEIIEKLKQEKFIDHQRYAAIYVRDKVITGKWGTTKIKAGLRAKQIENTIIEQAILEHTNADQELEQLHTMLQKMYDKEKNKCETTYKLKAKLYSRAAYRGYSSQAITTTLSKIITK